MSYARRQTTLDVWVVVCVATMALDRAGDEAFYLQQTGGQYLLTGSDSPNKTARREFEIRVGQSPGIFVLAFGSEGISLIVCFPSDTYMY